MGFYKSEVPTNQKKIECDWSEIATEYSTGAHLQDIRDRTPLE